MKGNIRNSDLSLVVVAGIILFVRYLSVLPVRYRRKKFLVDFL